MRLKDARLPESRPSSCAPDMAAIFSVPKITTVAGAPSRLIVAAHGSIMLMPMTKTPPTTDTPSKTFSASGLEIEDSTKAASRGRGSGPDMLSLVETKARDRQRGAAGCMHAVAAEPVLSVLRLQLSGVRRPNWPGSANVQKGPSHMKLPMLPSVPVALVGGAAAHMASTTRRRAARRIMPRSFGQYLLPPQTAVRVVTAHAPSVVTERCLSVGAERRVRRRRRKRGVSMCGSFLKFTTHTIGLFLNLRPHNEAVRLYLMPFGP